MLTVDMVGARRRGDELTLRAPTATEITRADLLGASILECGSTLVGRCRADVERTLMDLPHEESEARLFGALCKLFLDGCEFQSTSPALCAEARAAVFSAAATARRVGGFDRASVIAQSAAQMGLEAETLEQRLGADTPRRDILVVARPGQGPDLRRTWQLARIQAIVLRARELRCRIPETTPAAFRSLLRALKFRNLLFTLVPTEQGHLLTVTGPTHMFQAGTRYGFELALSLKSLARLNAQIQVDVLWGTERRVLLFESQLESGWLLEPANDREDPRIAKLCADLAKERVHAERNTRVLHIPGVGSVVPDLHVTFDGRQAYVELLGYWNRDAVFQRADWSMHHAGIPVLFCAQERLRVSESVLAGAESAALYVYKESLRGRRVAEMLRGLPSSQCTLTRLNG